MSSDDEDAQSAAYLCALAAKRREAKAQPMAPSPQGEIDQIAVLLGGVARGEAAKEVVANAVGAWKNYTPSPSGNPLSMCPPPLRSAMLDYAVAMFPDQDPEEVLQDPDGYQQVRAALQELKYAPPTKGPVPIPAGTPGKHPIQLGNVVRAQCSVAARQGVLEFHFPPALLEKANVTISLLMSQFRGDSEGAFDEIDEGDEEAVAAQALARKADYATLVLGDDEEAVQRVKQQMVARTQKHQADAGR